jgi:hypothetical protein
MTRESFWKKWSGCSVGGPGVKREFMRDLNSLIDKHKAPFISALENISQEIAEITEGEIRDAENQAERLG